MVNDMKKAILTLAVLCGIGMTAMAQTDIQNDTAIFPYDMFLAPEHPPEFIGGEDSLYAFLKKNGIPHGCVCLEDGILLDIFSPMREDFVN